MENVETEVPEMFTLMDAYSLACSCGILGLVAPEKLLSKYILRQLISEDVEERDNGSSSWHTKLYDQLRIRFPKKSNTFFV